MKSEKLVKRKHNAHSHQNTADSIQPRVPHNLQKSTVEAAVLLLTTVDGCHKHSPNLAAISSGLKILTS